MKFEEFKPWLEKVKSNHWAEKREAELENLSDEQLREVIKQLTGNTPHPYSNSSNGMLFRIRVGNKFTFCINREAKYDAKCQITVVSSSKFAPEINQLLSACTQPGTYSYASDVDTIKLYTVDNDISFMEAVIAGATDSLRKVGTVIIGAVSAEQQNLPWLQVSRDTVVIAPAALAKYSFEVIYTSISKVVSGRTIEKKNIGMIAADTKADHTALKIVWEQVNATDGITEVTCNIDDLNQLTHPAEIASLVDIDFSKPKLPPITLKGSNSEYSLRRCKFSNADEHYIKLSIRSKAVYAESVARLRDSLAEKHGELSFCLNLLEPSVLHAVVQKFKPPFFGLECAFGKPGDKAESLSYRSDFRDFTLATSQFSLIKAETFQTLFRQGHVNRFSLQVTAQQDAPAKTGISIPALTAFANAACTAESVTHFHAAVTSSNAAEGKQIIELITTDEFLKIKCTDLQVISDDFSLKLSMVKYERMSSPILVLEFQGLLVDVDSYVKLISGTLEKVKIGSFHIKFPSYTYSVPIIVKLLDSNVLFDKPNLAFLWRSSNTNMCRVDKGILTIDFASEAMGDEIIEPLANFCNRNKIYSIQLVNTSLNNEANYGNFNRFLSLLETVADISLENCSLQDASVDSALANLFGFKGLRSLKLSGGIFVNVSDGRLINAQLSYSGLIKIFARFKSHASLASIEITFLEINHDSIELLKPETKATIKKRDNAPGKYIHSLKFIRTFQSAPVSEAKKALDKLSSYGQSSIANNHNIYAKFVSDIAAHTNKTELPTQEKQRLERVLLNQISLYAFDITNGNSLLHACAVNNCVAIAAILLARNFNVHIRNHAGQTARELALSLGHQDFVDLIDNPSQKSSAATTSSTATSTKKRKANKEQDDKQHLEKRANTATETADVSTTSHPVGSLLAPNVSSPSIPVGAQTTTPALPVAISPLASLKSKYHAMIFAHDYRAVKNALAEDDISVIAVNIFHAAILVANIDITYLLLCNPKTNQCLTAVQYKALFDLVEEQYAKPYFSAEYRQRLTQIKHLMKAHENVSSTHGKVGLIWSDDLHVIYGGNYGKQKFVSIPAEAIHRELKARTDYYFFQNRSEQFQRAVKNNTIQQQDNDDDDEVLENDGNIVAATLTFVISEQSHNSNSEKRRVAVTIPLQANRNLIHVADHHEIVDGDEHKEIFKNNILARIKPIEAMASELGAHVGERVENLSEADSMVGFVQDFHHSEQALYEHMEQEQTVAEIVTALRQTNSFRLGCKVYAMILDIHSAPNYMCGNCQLSALGEQHPTSKFLTQLTTQLEDIGCSVPRKFGLRMITRVTAEDPTGSKKSKEALDERRHDHHRFFVDLRFVDNDLILSKDVTTTNQSSVIFSSRPR